MIHRRLLGAAYAALVVAGAFSAQAADLPSKKMAPEPIFVPPPFTWTGFYIGANAGGIFSTGGNASTTIFASGFPFLTTDWPNGSFGNSNSGFIGGGQAGYNWQTGSFVLGVETDFDGSSLSRSRSFIGPSFVEPINGFNDNFTANGSVRLNWLGSTRARVGWAVTPDSRLMIYGTGGVAYGGGSAHLNVFDADNGWFWSSGNNSATRTGWVIGGGAEYAFTNNIIFGAEYLYYNLGSKTLSAVPNLAASTFFGPNVFSSTKVDFNASVIRARLSYKF
jgi:outer membrane immunogenic protein